MYGENLMQDFGIKYFYEYTTHVRQFHLLQLCNLIRSFRITLDNLI